jgi:hypothetical protein
VNSREGVKDYYLHDYPPELLIATIADMSSCI